MQVWELALETFLSEWKDKDFVIGAILTGSFATNNNTENSDIDVHLILSEEITWRERGNKYINGFLIEYFANPVVQLKKYMEEDYHQGIRTDANMFVTGKILFDKNDVVAKLKELAQSYISKPFEPVNNISLELMKYRLFDEFENIKDNYETESFNYYYYIFLEMLLMTYKNYLGAELPSNSKIYKFFTSETFRARYNLKPFPDPEFVKSYLEGITLSDKSEKYALLEKLTQYTLAKMGGFKIDGWKINTPVEE